MGYKYIPAGMNSYNKTPQQTYIDLFQETLNQQFYNASDIWHIQEEYPIASKEYKDVDVRIDHVINAETGLKLGDDWKTLLFKELDHELRVGRLYYFNDNVWITVNTEVIRNLSATATIKRCNNVLRWIDEKTGAYYEEPCSIEYLVKEPRDYSTSGSSIVIPGGFVNVRVQFNEQTNKIKPNQRFLFGNPDNWTAYKVVGTGRNVFVNLETYNDMSAGIIVLDMLANYVNYETDDIVNGIADLHTNVYDIKINQSIIDGSVGSTFQLTTTITYNGDVVTRDVEWSSSNEKFVTVSSSGLVTMIANGSAIITANIKDNSASDTSSINVSASPNINSDVVITPNTNFILEKSKKTFTVYLYENGLVQADTFTITCNENDVPLKAFVFTQVDGNTFSIQNNEKSLTSYLTITCVSGTNTKTTDITLRGAW